MSFNFLIFYNDISAFSEVYDQYCIDAIKKSHVLHTSEIDKAWVEKVFATIYYRCMENYCYYCAVNKLEIKDQRLFQNIYGEEAVEKFIRTICGLLNCDYDGIRNVVKDDFRKVRGFVDDTGGWVCFNGDGIINRGREVFSKTITATALFEWELVVSHSIVISDNDLEEVKLVHKMEDTMNRSECGRYAIISADFF